MMFYQTVLTLLCMVCLVVLTISGCGSIGSLSESRHWVPILVSDPGIGETPESYYDITLVGPGHGYVTRIVESPDLELRMELLCTKDDGKSWQASPIPYGGMCLVNERIIWIIGDEWISITRDGGETWRRTEIKQEGLDLWGEVFPLSESEAWAISRGRGGNALVHTLDGGATWTKTPLPDLGTSDVSLGGLFFFDRNHGWVVISGVLVKEPTGEMVERSQPVILRTEDGGKTFNATHLSSSVHLGIQLPYRLDFSDPLEGWAATGDAALLHTTDGGKTWDLEYPDVQNDLYLWPLYDCSFPTPLEGWAVGHGGSALHTRDGGKTWERVETGAEGIKNVELQRVIFVDKDHGWIAGEGGIRGSDTPPRPEHMISFVLKYVP
jgi:photosystem II stability/assembly factor-like uncharacterized protein